MVKTTKDSLLMGNARTSAVKMISNAETRVTVTAKIF